MSDDTHRHHHVHDLLVWKLSKELSKEYDSVRTNVPIKGKSRLIGEIDIIAKREGQVHIFEVKCSFRITKAKKQFKRIRQHLGDWIDNYYLYCGDTDSIIEIQF